jgi:two-component system LytT family response regulator
MTVLIVDDEQPARERLRVLLAGIDDVEVAGEADNAETAMALVASSAPDVVLLDIQMPECSGLEMAASLKGPRPLVIFCTAFDQHAVDAFELNAVDYVLKPVTRARLEQAIARARTRLAEGRPTPETTTLGYPRRFLGRRLHQYHVVRAEDVLWFATEEGLTRLYTRDAQYWMDPTLTELESRLDPAEWFRVSRSAIVQLDAITDVVPGDGGHGHARLVDARTVAVSRRRLSTLLERLSRM